MFYFKLGLIVKKKKRSHTHHGMRIYFAAQSIFTDLCMFNQGKDAGNASKVLSPNSHHHKTHYTDFKCVLFI